MIKKNNICFRFYDDFATKKLSAAADNQSYYMVEQESNIVQGEPDIPYHAFVTIKDRRWCWTRGKLLQWVTKDDIDALENKLNSRATSAALGAATQRIATLESAVEQLQQALLLMQESIDQDSEVTASALTDINERLELIDERGEVTASALTDLNERLETIES